MPHKLILSPAEAMLLTDRALKADALKAQAVELQRRADGVVRAAVNAIAKAHDVHDADGLDAHIETGPDGALVGVELRERATT